MKRDSPSPASLRSATLRTSCGPGEQHPALSCVLREGSGALEFSAGFVDAAELGQEIATHLCWL
jgi:hypothetical protein